MMTSAMILTQGLTYEHQIVQNTHSGNQSIHIIRYHAQSNPHLTLLISKVSEAILPNTTGNHVGEGDMMDNFLAKQSGVRFIINGGFNHYRKNFYSWSHQNFNVGDPVGLVKIREHLFEDYIDLAHYGFLVQQEKKAIWQIMQKQDLSLQEKYILGCTPLLIFKGQKLHVPSELMIPMNDGVINPPSILGHGLQYHPRTAVGIKGEELVFLTIEGNTYHDNQYYPGCTLPELQDIGMKLGLDSLLNLDGGGSSQFRLRQDNGQWIQNVVHEEDQLRVLGHVLVIFDETLKCIK